MLDEIIRQLEGSSEWYQQSHLLLSSMVYLSALWLGYSVSLFIYQVTYNGINGRYNINTPFHINFFGLSPDRRTEGAELALGTMLWMALSTAIIAASVWLYIFTPYVITIAVAYILVVKLGKHIKNSQKEEIQEKVPCEIDRAKAKYLKDIMGKEEEECTVEYNPRKEYKLW